MAVSKNNKNNNTLFIEDKQIKLQLFSNLVLFDPKLYKHKSNIKHDYFQYFLGVWTNEMG